VILFLGARGVIKGIFPLLEAMPLVKKSVPEAQCIIAGGEYRFSGRLSSRIARQVFPLVGWGTVAQRVDKLMDRYSLHDYVHMLPWREDVERLLAASDVVAFPSVQPHFARPVIEAGAMAKPVVASRIGGVEELVEDGETGLLAPPGNAVALAEALVGILRDREEAKRLGEEGFRLSRQRYDASENIARIAGIYRRLLEVG
jgi:glycosyltransferase involved in cell wall biosynthesis